MPMGLFFVFTLCLGKLLCVERNGQLERAVEVIFGGIGGKALGYGRKRIYL